MCLSVESKKQDVVFCYILEYDQACESAELSSDLSLLRSKGREDDLTATHVHQDPEGTEGTWPAWGSMSLEFGSLDSPVSN